ncbi:MAG TPA: alpha/beta hydrolase, partial [Gemmatimonadales bacterium]|nr:alpha/beta hydrolase [Gemmatimonadales bacterium]
MILNLVLCLACQQGPLDRATILNAQYRLPSSKSIVRVRDGNWSQASANSRQALTIVDMNARGDLNGDGVPDAVVLLVYSSGGSGVFNYLAAVLNDHGAAKHVSSTALGDRVKVQAIDLVNGRAIADLTVQGDHDPACCPTVRSTRAFAFVNGQLVESAHGTRSLVDIGGRHLDVLRTGSGGPPVVFEVGLADSLDTWIPVSTAIGESTTAIAYSRAGFGRSDPSPDGYSAHQAVTDLHELLHRLPIAAPYILVGRSYGGLLMRLYTSLYPADVAGLVIVDGTHEQQVQRYGQLDSTYPAAFRAYYDSVLRTLAPSPEAGEIRETVRIQTAGTVEGMTPLPDIPLAVLTSMRSDPA